MIHIPITTARARTITTIGMLASLLLGGACSRNKADAGATTATTALPSDSLLMAKGLDLYRAGDASGAVETFQAVLKRNPSHYGAHYQLARALDRAGKPTDARPAWTNVLDLAERNADTSSARIARARLAQPDTVSQERMMSIGLDLLYAQHDPIGAATEFRKVLERNPVHYGAHFQLATALDDAGRKQEARQWWKRMQTLAETIGDRRIADVARDRLHE